MQLTINAQDSLAIKPLRGVIKEKVVSVLARMEKHVSRISVYMADQNGPRGGVDKVCRILVKLRRGGEIPVEDRGARWYYALSGAADRLRSSIRRRLAKWRTNKVRAGRKGYYTDVA